MIYRIKYWESRKDYIDQNPTFDDKDYNLEDGELRMVELLFDGMFAVEMYEKATGKVYNNTLS